MTIKGDMAFTISIFFLSYLISFIGNILISRWLGAEDFGDFSVVVSMATIGSAIAIFGLGKVAMKQLTLYHKNDNAGLAKGYILFGLRFVFLFGVVLGVVGVVVHEIFALINGRPGHPVIYAAVLLPLVAVTNFLTKVMVSTGRRNSAIFTQKIVHPSVVLIGAFCVLKISGQLSDWAVVWVVIASWVLVLLIYFPTLFKEAKRRFAGQTPEYRRAEWTKNALVFWIPGVAMICLYHAGVILMEVMHESEIEVGIFAAVNHTASFFIVIAQAFCILAIPAFSILLAKDDKKGLEALLRSYQTPMLVLCIALTSLFVFFGEQILALYNPEYADGYEALCAFATGYFINVMLCFTTAIIQVSGQGRIVVFTTVSFLAMYVGISVVLIPSLGSLGGGIGYSVSAIAIYLFQLYWVRYKLGIKYFSLS